MPLLDLTQTPIKAVVSGGVYPAGAAMVLPYEPHRLVATLYGSTAANNYFSFARAASALNAQQITYAGWSFPLELYGPEEIWVVSSGGGSLLPVSLLYQAIYHR